MGVWALGSREELVDQKKRRRRSDRKPLRAEYGEMDAPTNDAQDLCFPCHPPVARRARQAVCFFFFSFSSSFLFLERE
jgi:hypothetical protein